MPVLKAKSLLFILALVGSLFLNLVPEALDFMTLDHESLRDRNTLIKKVHARQWTIHAHFSREGTMHQACFRLKNHADYGIIATGGEP